jgi:hypothetical protein
LAKFGSLTYDFTSNPLHLQMICETEGVENLQQPDLISLYEQFLSKKIKHGLATCRQIEEGVSYDFPRKFKHIYGILTKCAEAQVLDKRGEIVQFEEDRSNINLSGVATVVDDKSPLVFVHLTFAEFLTARKFIQMFFGPIPDMGKDAVQLFVRKLFKEGVSKQTMRFVEGFCDKKKDIPFHTGVLDYIKEIQEEIFKHICRVGMPNLYSFLLGKVFYGLEVRQWLLESHVHNQNGMSLYLNVCISSPQLATLLSESEWCPMLQVDDFDTFFEKLYKRTCQRLCYEIAFSRVEGFKSRWPRAKFFDEYLDHRFIFTEAYEFLFDNCPDIDIDGLVHKIYSQKRCCHQILPILLRLGADLICENNGVRIAHIIFGDKHGRGNIELLNFAIKVGKHFQVTDNFDSEESLLLRKNIGAKSPQELELDSDSHERRGLYLEHIVECACALLDTGECHPNYRSRDINQEGVLMEMSNIPELRPIANTYKLQLMRTVEYSEKARIIFQEEKQWIPRDFTYSCGCTLVHDACRNHNLPLLETLHQNGFELNTANKTGETPLHLSLETVRCTELLLKRFLGQSCVPFDAKREEIIARTPDEQQHAENTLGERDAAGRTPLLAAAFKWGCVATQVAKLLIYNMLGPLVFLKNEEVETRTELEQQQVERILGVRDASGWTALHGAMNCQEKYELLELMLINLLGINYINGTKKPMQRTLEKQQQIAQLMQPKSNKGQTALRCDTQCYVYGWRDSYLLLLRNLLGEFFVEKDGTTAKPLNARTQEENQFVRDVMFNEDDEGRSLYGMIQTYGTKPTKLLYETNASYLLLKKPK